MLKKQTDEICLEAVKQNGLVLDYVKKQTEEICIEAVKDTKYAIYSVKNMTERIQKEADKKKFETFSEMIAKHN